MDSVQTPFELEQNTLPVSAHLSHRKVRILPVVDCATIVINAQAIQVLLRRPASDRALHSDDVILVTCLTYQDEGRRRPPRYTDFPTCSFWIRG
ncbi:hypothetical protein PGT21_012337 [Puccinia graminis f. sp. tritici]|uniref:Uncharacterized protein n=1 Tax=Puccinia graminis f. sp. tritici TaxID=56615 RepID=A0A5B0NDE0_PUCGR|nr:hypothetical protein PGT21_012337 [Puccinia graminis f. sp. tritici]